jgi:catechol 2,3-dioxygenase-like lactoylglutathione lyase family enzyme
MALPGIAHFLARCKPLRGLRRASPEVFRATTKLPVTVTPQPQKQKDDTMFKRVDHFAYHFDDVASATDYFVETYGFEKVYDTINKAGQPITYIQLAGLMIELTTRPGGEPMSGFHMCLEASDIDATAQKLKDQGLTVLTELRAVTPRGEEQKGWKRGVFRGKYGEIVEIKGGPNS